MKKIRLTEVVYDDDCGNIPYYYDCYLLNKLPKEREYFDYGKDKGYVIQIIEEPIKEKEYKRYSIWYEKNLDDWNNQIIDIAEICNVCIKR